MIPEPPIIHFKSFFLAGFITAVAFFLLIAMVIDHATNKKDPPSRYKLDGSDQEDGNATTSI